MSTAIVIILLIALLVSALGTVALYYAIWHGALKPLRQQWREWDSATRRREIVALAMTLVLVTVLAALLIISPFGRFTIAYIMGGFGVILVVGVPIYAALLAWRNTHGQG